MPLSKGKRALAPSPPSMTRRRTHFVSPKLTRKMRQEKGGYGVFATRPILAGELLVVWGGDIATSDELAELPPLVQRHSIQVEEGLYMVPHEMPEVGDFVNHSCSPNAGLSGQTSVVAMRAIAKGEEICYDYAMSDGSAYDEFTCSCGSILCRGAITGGDWALPELQERYAGYFSPYLQRRIDDMCAELRALDKPGLSVVGGFLTDISS